MPFKEKVVHARAERMGERLQHTCVACQEYIATDALSIYRRDDEHVWFMHIEHNPEMEGKL